MAIICKICGGSVGNEVACCARCFTPHHFDCWSFAGQCSVYACGEKEHRYFDFRDKSEADLLAAIGQSLAVALREDAAAPRARPAAGGRADASRNSAGDLLAYRRAMFRSLHAVLSKVAPGRLDGDADLVGSFEQEVEGREPPRLFLAEDLDIDTGSQSGDMQEKKRLLHSLAASSNLPDRPRPWLERLREWLRALFG